MITRQAVDEIPATEACRLAAITYRQLDHWARRGWVRPSIDVGLGRAGRRLYGPADVIRLGALGHFGQSRLDVGKLGPQLADLDLPLENDFLLIAADDGTIEVVSERGLRSAVTASGAWVVFDPYPVRVELGLTGPVLVRHKKVRSA